MSASFFAVSADAAWGTFGNLIPIGVPVAQAVDPGLVIVSLSATLDGYVFGDHCSPISDTTILSSAGAGCSHIEHVATQIPYAWLVAVASFVGYAVAGFTNANLWLRLGTTRVILIGSISVLHMMGNAKREGAAA